MDGAILLQRTPHENGGTLSRDIEIQQDPEHLLEQLRQDPGKTPWVMIAADIADGPRLAERLREADPAVNVVLLGSDGTSSEALGGLLSAADTEQHLAATTRRAQRAEKLASMTTLTARIAHDIGTPMTAILGYAELLAKSAESEKNRKRAGTIVEQVRRVSDRIATLMNLTQSQDHAPTPLALGGLVEQALEFFQEKLERYGIEIERDDQSAPRILGDPGRLHLALLHLLYRAIEAMPEGGRLLITLTRTDGNHAELRISDSGAPIDIEQQSALLEAGGPELGLVVARALVEDHQGTLMLRAGPLGGAEFCMRFPSL